MNYLLAKVKQKPNLFTVLSDEDIFETPQGLENSHDYNPVTLLEEGEWYKIQEFAQKAFSLDFLQTEFNIVSYNQIAKADYSKIRFLCSVQENLIFFQRMLPTLLLKKKWFAIDEPSLIKDKPIIFINSLPDAVYDKASNILYFKKLTAIKTIFPGIDTLYREATDAETQTFLNSDFLRMKDGFNVQSVNSLNRKRIAMVLDVVNAFTPERKAQLQTYIHGYRNIPFENGCFEISCDDDLKHILYGIDERFYTTAHGEEKRIANSVIKITQ